MGTMRMLEISPVQMGRVKDLVSFASKPENWYVPGDGKWAGKCPGDDPFYCVKLNDFRCVFTHTNYSGKLIRHLSVSVSGTSYPGAPAVFTIATLFGFTGAKMMSDIAVYPGRNWGINVNEQDRCVIVTQDMEPTGV